MPAALAAIKKSCDSYKREGERQWDPNERLLGAQMIPSSRSRAGIILYQYTATTKLNTASPKHASAR